MTADKAALEREVNALRTDNDRLRANTETMVAEKWELSAANAGITLLNSNIWIIDLRLKLRGIQINCDSFYVLF